MKGKPVPSKVLSNTHESFERKFEALCKEHGYHMYMAVLGEAIDNDCTSWSSFGRGVCDGLVEFLERITDELKDDLDEHGGCNHD